MEFWSKFKQGLEALCQTEVCLPICHATALEEAIAYDPTLAMLAQRLWLLQLKLSALSDRDDTLADDTEADLEVKLNPECQHKLIEFRQLLANKMQASEAETGQLDQFALWRRSRQKDLQQRLQTTERQIILAIRAHTLDVTSRQLKLESDTAKSSAKLAARSMAKSRIWDAVNHNLHLSDVPDPDLSRFNIVPTAQVLLHIPSSSEVDLLSSSALFSVLTTQLKQFCQNYTVKDRPVDLLDGEWFNGTFTGRAAVADIFSMLKTEPIIVLESDVFAEILYLHLGYWGLSCTDYRYVLGLLEIDLRQCLNNFAKQSALEWWKGLKQATAQGITPEQYSENFDPQSVPIFIDNLKAIEQEQNARQSGIDIDTSDMVYAFCQSDLDRLQRCIVSAYCILIGFQLDEYFLFNPIPKLRLRPLLPQLLTELLNDLSAEEMTDIVSPIARRYQFLYQRLQEQEPLAYPELCLDLGLSFSSLSEKSWAQEQIVQSMHAWQDLHNINPVGRDETFTDLINSTIANTTLEDWDYLNQLNQCLTAIGYSRKISFADSYFERGKLKYYAEDYQDAIANFSQAIALDESYVEAYLYRGLAYTSLGKYQVAIGDYNHAIEVQPDLAQAYNYRGNTYRELGDCRSAIIDYDRALGLDPNLTSASSDRQITLDMMAGLERDRSAAQRIGNGRSREFDYEVVRLNSNGKEINRRVNRARLLIQDITSASELSATLEMIYIPNGVCFMGSSDREAGREMNEGPQHWVNISSFFIAKSPVTQLQWQVVANLPPSNPAKPLILNPDPSEFKGSDRPVESISWFEAMEFCTRLSQATGKNYRLPSETEWEYACRGGTKTPFCYGHTISTELANYDGTSGYGFGPVGEYRSQTLSVGSFPVCNPFGLVDVHGQVWEWCADPWHENYQNAPTNNSIWDEDGDDEYRIVRGGSWFAIPGRCRAAARGKYTPDVWLNQLGFRVALSI